MAVALLAGTHELHFEGPHFYLRRPEVTEHTEVRLASQLLFERLSHLYATTHHHDIDIVRRAFKENVTHIATHHIAFELHVVGHFTNQVENLLIKNLCQFLV